MSLMVRNKRPQVPTILSVYGPIEEYWTSSRLARSIGLDPEQVLDPFDALLVHLVLERTPGSPVLVDLAIEPTGGASSLIGLTHPHARRVVAVSTGETEKADRILSDLGEFNRGRDAGLVPIDVIPAADLTASLPELSHAVILADVRGGGMATLADDIGRWLDAQPDALVLLLGLGRVGECPALGSLIRLCTTDSGTKLRLFRELGEALAASQLGMVARQDHPHAAEILLRIQNLYTGNYRFLDLLKSVNLAEVRAAQIDAEVMRTHPLSRGLVAEPCEPMPVVQEPMPVVQELWEEPTAFPFLPPEAPPESPPGLPPSFLARVRRKLAPGIVGKLWRFSKRVMRKCKRLFR